MRKAFFAFTLIAVLSPLAAAQDSKISPPLTLRENGQITRTQPDAEPRVSKTNSTYPPFCHRKSCLYYAGDFESSYSASDGLFNANYTGGGLEGQVWVGVKPDKDATITGATFVEFATSGYMGTNPTPFAIQVAIKPGQAGRTVCSTSGNATIKIYGGFWEVPAYAFIIQKLSQSCKLKKGRLYYVNLLPTSGNGYAYLLNLEPTPPNQHGWKDIPNHCYFNGPVFGQNWVTCDSQGLFARLQIALTGQETK